MPASRPFCSGDRFALLRLAVGGAALAGMVTLAGCTGSGQPTENGGAGADPVSSAPASSAPASSAPADGAGKDDSGDKPSKQEVVDGLTDFYRTSQGLSAKKAKAFAVCMTDELYDKASTNLLIMMKDGKPDPAKATTDDKEKLGAAGVKCAPEIQ